MRWENVETLQGGAKADGGPVISETLYLKDRDGNTVATFSKVADESYSFDVNGVTADAQLNADELAAIQGAAAPDGTNVFATMDDVGGGGGGTSQVLSTTDAVDMNTATASLLYTVPAGKIAIVSSIVIRDASTSLTTVSMSFGWNSTAFNNVITDATHTELTGSTKVSQLHSDPGGVVGTAADTLKAKCNILQGGAATVSIDVLGYLITA